MSRVSACYADTRTLTPAGMAAALGLLSPEERARHDALSREEDRRDYAAAHALLRLVLAAQTNIPPAELLLAADPYGKPFLPSQRHLSYSMSRSQGLAACVVGVGCTVGIDVEAVDESVPASDLARELFAADEAQAIERCPAAERAARFCELWTLKEAFLKAIGTGLGWPLSGVAFDLCRRRVALAQLPHFAAKRWAFLVVDVGTAHRLSIAVGDEAR